MVQFFKKNPALRLILIAGCFVLGMVLIVVGFKGAADLKNLGIMCIGLLLLLVALWVYNVVFTDPKKKTKKTK